MSFYFNVKYNLVAFFYQETLSLVNTEFDHRWLCELYVYRCNNHYRYPGSIFYYTKPITYVLLTFHTNKLKEEDIALKNIVQIGSSLY